MAGKVGGCCGGGSGGSAFTCSQLNPCSITNLGDVDTSTAPPGAGNTLVWDGTNWVPGTGGGSSTVITADTPTVDMSGDGTAATPITAVVRRSADAGNTLVTGSDGALYVGPPCISTDAGNAIVRGADGCLYSATSSGGGLTSVATQDTPTVDLAGDGTAGSPVTATVRLSGDTGNTIVTGSDGALYSGPPCISTDAGNTLVRGADGCLYAPTSSGGGLTAVATQDTPTVDMSGDGTAGAPITAVVNRSTDAGNTLTVGSDGALYVPTPTDTTNVVGINPGTAVSTSRSVDIDVVEGPADTFTVGARLTPVWGTVTGGGTSRVENIPNNSTAPLAETFVAPEPGVYSITVDTAGELTSGPAKNTILDIVSSYLTLNGAVVSNTTRQLAYMDWGYQPDTVTNRSTDQGNGSATVQLQLNAGDTIGVRIARQNDPLNIIPPASGMTAWLERISWHKIAD